MNRETFGRKRPLPISTSFVAQQSNSGPGRLIVDEFRSHSIGHTHTHTHIHTHMHPHTTRGRTPLDERSVRRRDLRLTTNSTHRRDTYMPPTGSEPAIPASQGPQTHALDRAVTSMEQLQLKS